MGDISFYEITHEKILSLLSNNKITSKKNIKILKLIDRHMKSLSIEEIGELLGAFDWAYLQDVRATIPAARQEMIMNPDMFDQPSQGMMIPGTNIYIPGDYRYEMDHTDELCKSVDWINYSDFILTIDDNGPHFNKAMYDKIYRLYDYMDNISSISESIHSIDDENCRILSIKPILSLAIGFKDRNVYVGLKRSDPDSDIYEFSFVSDDNGNGNLHEDEDLAHFISNTIYKDYKGTYICKWDENHNIFICTPYDDIKKNK